MSCRRLRGSCRLESKVIALESDQDIDVARNQVRAMAPALGLRVLDQTKLTTIPSALARNVIKYASRGRMIAQPVEEASGRVGLRLVFEDEGAGIVNLADVMRDGYSTSRGLGQGLPGSRRLADEFEIESEVGRGTNVTVVRWKS